MSLGKPKLGPLSIQTPFGASCSRGGAMGQRVSQPSGGALRGRWGGWGSAAGGLPGAAGAGVLRAGFGGRVGASAGSQTL